MLTISAGELTGMRDEINDALPGTAVIHTATKTFTAGDSSWTYAAAGTYDGRLSPVVIPGGIEQRLADRVTEISTYILTLPHTATVDEDDRVVFNNVTYEVEEVRTFTPWNLDVRCKLKEID